VISLIHSVYKNKKQRQTHKYRGQTEGCQERWGEDGQKWVEGSGRYRLLVTEGVSHGDKRYSIGNIVSGIRITLYGDRW